MRLAEEQILARSRSSTSPRKRRAATFLTMNAATGTQQIDMQKYRAQARELEQLVQEHAEESALQSKLLLRHQQRRPNLLDSAAISALF
jgi:hypothetical protein